MPGDFWDAVCAFCSPQETCPTDSSSVVVGGPGRELSAEQADDNLHELLAMSCNSSQLRAGGMQAKALLCRRLMLCFFCGWCE